MTVHRFTQAATTLSRTDVEDYLYEDARLLDGWLLQEWLQTMSDEIRYTIPATDSQGVAGAGTTWTLVDDDRRLLEGRVTRLMSRRAHVENPRSRTRRLLTNVRIVTRGDNEIDAGANFVIYRSQYSGTVSYVGRYELTLSDSPGGIVMSKRYAILDAHNLFGCGGVVPIIL